MLGKITIESAAFNGLISLEELYLCWVRLNKGGDIPCIHFYKSSITGLLLVISGTNITGIKKELRVMHSMGSSD